ncbi:tetratricopeptide repeat protein [Hamadaea sp.]|uniref:ATP-binding protein n=1 Tax=Hamadaea sp. TaxID=2024425 RepID=UPI0025BFB1F3|nr:tetratricopeptide repeat protein [Hamadaea sp.]
MRERRALSGLSQDDLARAAGIDVKTIRNIEAGRNKPRPSTLRLLADALGIEGKDRDRLFAAAAPIRSAVAQTTVPTPAQLPADVRFFAGRDAHLATIHAALDVAATGGSSTAAVPIVAISGSAGVGKTALAVHWAHRVRDRFPGGQLYVNLRGFGPFGSAVQPAEAIRGFLDALGVPPQRLPVDLDAQAALYRSVLAGKRMLIVLDNARDAEQIRPLLPGVAGCAVVVTSRRALVGLVAADGAHPVVLDLFTHAEARELLTARLGDRRISAEPASVDELIDRCARLPLALVVAAARLATRPDLPLTSLVEHLRQAKAGLDAWAADDAPTDVRTVFSWSYRQLSMPAARLFRLLGLHPGPSLSASAAASLAGVGLDEVRRSLRELTGMHLLAEYTPGRYAFHDLLRAYAAELVNADDEDGDRDPAVRRVLDHYVHNAFAAARLLSPHRDPIGVPGSSEHVLLETLGDGPQAMRWFAAEHQVLLSALDLAIHRGLDAYAEPFAWSVTDYLQRKGHWQDQAAVHITALAATRRLDDRRGQARAHRHLSRAFILMGRLDDAYAHCQQALELAEQVGDVPGQAHMHLNAANLLEQRGDLPEALVHAQRGLELFATVENKSGQARARNMVGWFHARLGRYRDALTHCELALTELLDINDKQGQIFTWDSMGYIHHHLGRHEQAVLCFQHALGLAQQSGDQHSAAVVLNHLGDNHESAGDLVSARDVWQEALDIFTELSHADADEMRAKLARLGTSSTPL